MATIGAEAVKDVYWAALKVVAAFKDDAVREHLHRVQIQCLQDLEDSCRFVHELTVKEHDHG